VFLNRGNMKRFLASVKKEPRPISQPVTLISKMSPAPSHLASGLY